MSVFQIYFSVLDVFSSQNVTKQTGGLIILRTRREYYKATTWIYGSI